jgi:hypothetical protein
MTNAAMEPALVHALALKIASTVAQARAGRGSVNEVLLASYTDVSGVEHFGAPLDRGDAGRAARALEVDSLALRMALNRWLAPRGLEVACTYAQGPRHVYHDVELTQYFALVRVVGAARLG